MAWYFDWEGTDIAAFSFLPVANWKTSSSLFVPQASCLSTVRHPRIKFLLQNGTR